MNLQPIHLLPRRCAVALAAASLLSAATGASAAISGSTADVNITPGGLTSVEFKLDFGALTQLTSFNFGVFFDPALLELQPTISVSPDALGGDALALAGLFSEARPSGAYAATWYAFDENFQPKPPLSLSGVATIEVSFAAIGLAFGDTTPVSLVLDWTDEAGDEGPRVDLVSTVTAIPEPQTLALMLAGAGIVAAVRRKQIQR
jgi:hypothetical protein